MQVISKDEIRGAWEALKDRMEVYHYFMWRLEKENGNDGYERVH